MPCCSLVPKPRKKKTLAKDKTTALKGVSGLLSTLWQRRGTGVGQGAFQEAADVHEGRDKHLLVLSSHHGVIYCVRGVRDCLTSAPVISMLCTNIRVEDVKGFC